MGHGSAMAANSSNTLLSDGNHAKRGCDMSSSENTPGSAVSVFAPEAYVRPCDGGAFQEYCPAKVLVALADIRDTNSNIVRKSSAPGTL